MSWDPFARLDGDYVAEKLRPDLDQRYRNCLACTEVLREPAERRSGLHEKCVSAWSRKTTGHVGSGL